MIYDTLYSYDSNGKLRFWYAEQNDDKYRVVSGQDGTNSPVTSTWKVATPKNVGKANETTAIAQAALEINSLYNKNIKKGWSSSVEGITTPYIEPMLAAKYESGKTKLDFCNGVYVQPKLDGIRCVITKKGMFSREGEEFISCPHIFELLEPYLNGDTQIQAFDGELYNHDLKENFNEIQSKVMRNKNITPEFLIETKNVIQYHCYDIIPWDNTLKFEERLNILDGIENNINSDSFKEVTTVRVDEVDNIDEFACAMIESGFEGTMIRTNSPYQIGKRSKSLMKYKSMEDCEFEIVDIIEGKGNWSGMAKSIKVRLTDGQTNDCGMRGDQDFARDLLANKNEHIGTLATVMFQNFTPDGKLRFPVVTKFHKSSVRLA